MEAAIRSFLTFLDVEQGASRETIRGYRSDLRQFLAFASDSRTAGASPLAPDQVDPLDPGLPGLAGSQRGKEIVVGAQAGGAAESLSVFGQRGPDRT